MRTRPLKLVQPNKGSRPIYLRILAHAESKEPLSSIRVCAIYEWVDGKETWGKPGNYQFHSEWTAGYRMPLFSSLSCVRSSIDLVKVSSYRHVAQALALCTGRLSGRDARHAMPSPFVDRGRCTDSMLAKTQEKSIMLHVSHRLRLENALQKGRRAGGLGSWQRLQLLKV